MKQDTIGRIRKFTSDREWEQFHTPENLAKSISIEANELLECFQWNGTEYDLEHVKEELADVMVYCRNLLDALELDEDEIINAKMDKNEAKYPVEKAKGNSAKYDQLDDSNIQKETIEQDEIIEGHISELDLTMRLYNIFKREGLEEINDIIGLMKNDPEKIIRMKGLGRVSAWQLYHQMKSLGVNCKNFRKAL